MRDDDLVVLESGHVTRRALAPPGVPFRRKGMFVTVEGVDGAGKTTLARQLVGLLDNAVYTTEPYNRSHFDVAVWKSPEYIRDRREHVRDFIKPHVLAGHDVICDRYAGSQYAYQRVPWKVACPYEPDLTLLLDTPLDVCVQRVRERGEPFEHLAEVAERYESLEDHTRVARVRTCDDALCEIMKLLGLEDQ